MQSTLVEEAAIERLREHGASELSEQFASFRPQLRRMIALRSNHRLRQRVDDSDVVQEAYLEAVRRLDEYLACPRVSPDIWMRQIGRQVLAKQYRYHFGTAKRAIGVELEVDSLDGAGFGLLADSCTSVGGRVSRREVCLEVRRLLLELDPLEREVLCLKQLEGLTFEAIAAELEISLSTAKRRMATAIHHFRQLSAFLE